MGQLDDINDTTLVSILTKMADEVKDWIIISNSVGKIIYANEAVFKDCAYCKDQVLGHDMCMFVGVDLEDEKTLRHIQHFIDKGEKYEFITNRFVKENKRIYLVNTLTAVKVEQAIAYYVCISKDISNALRLKEEFYRANYLDVLTNYPNAKIFLETLDKQIERYKRIRKKTAILLIDIKRIGEINTHYGMSVGDFVIKEVGKRIKSVLNNQQEIFKYKGNIFSVIYSDLQDEAEIEELIETIYQVMEAPIQVQTRCIHVTLKIGISLLPDDALSTHQLIEMAQIALTHDKKQKINTHSRTYYSRAIHEEAEVHRQIEDDLQQAVANDEFIVYYQPFVDLKEEKLVGMEALVRRQTKDGQIISPGAFISTLEEMNLIEKVGIRVLEKVCMQVRQWMDLGYHVVPVSVNLSALQFRNPHLAEEIEAVLMKYDIEPSYIVLEITETTVMEDVESAKAIIEALKAYGFSISIDDFGTGYASIGYLKKFMFDHLKIDISFIREIVANGEDRAIVEAIIAIAKTLHLKTIAEGIENEEQLYVISALGCEMGQGYFWDKPISPSVIEEKYLICY